MSEHQSGQCVTQPPVVMTIDQAALYLNIPKATLYTWRTRCPQQAPPAVKVGGILRYRRRDLDAWLESHLESAK